MVQASQPRRLLVLGVLGEGKSTLMNLILKAHELEPQFEAKRSVEAATQAFQESSPFSFGPT